MKKLFTVVLGIILLFNPTFAKITVNSIPEEIENIGTIQKYQTGKNSFIGVNLNLELLFIADHG